LTVKTYAQLAEILQKEQEAVEEVKAIAPGQTVVAATPTPPGAYRSNALNTLNIGTSAFYCPYCSKRCNG
jgi:hypothetical protein